LNPLMAEQARPHYNDLIVRPIEAVHLDKKFDLVNCGDILEHLQDPWAMLKRLHALLYPDGYLVLSVPNAGHWSIVRGLLKGEFEYVPLGLLCIGHLRWFTESGLLQTLAETGFVPDKFQRQQLPPTPQGEIFIRDMCTKGYGNEQSLRTNEFIVRSRKRPRPNLT
ncbi:MAG: class I SAM-dependent methyltransferase, partial [Nitrospina sp.]|nr:class I SAM-dependent methyltransferase [Nitrospina sp.]